MIRIRAKTYLTVLPILVITTLASGFLSFFEARAALTRAANRHLAYKAEQLRDFIHSEWSVIEELKLSEDAAYREAARESFRSYAYSVLRSESERVLVVDGNGRALFVLGGRTARDESGPAYGAVTATTLPSGWFEGPVLGEERIGIAFPFEPFGWTVAITELRESFFSDADGILRTHAWILATAILLGSLLSAAYLGYIIGPLERLATLIEHISRTDDLTLRAEATGGDEIGLLGLRFNAFVATIDAQRTGLREANLAEQRALDIAVQREAETLFILGRISDYRDEETGAHLTRIGELAALFSRFLGRSEEEHDILRKSAPLHDIGKIGIPDAILLKPSELDESEFERMKQHTTLGHALLKDSQSRYLRGGAVIALSHHERWDGSGYPKGLKGEEIALEGRIVSVLDVFDALVSERPYKKAWPRDKALAYILEQDGKRFDPLLVKIFSARFADFAALYDEA